MQALYRLLKKRMCLCGHSCIKRFRLREYFHYIWIQLQISSSENRSATFGANVNFPMSVKLFC